MLYPAGEKRRDVGPALSDQLPKRTRTDEYSRSRGVTPQGLPVQDFRSLMRHMATLAMNQCCPSGLEQATFDVLTEPTALQRRALELLGISAHVWTVKGRSR